MTLQAASCWYRAWLSSCLAVCSCCLRVKLCSITASHSSCSDLRMAGIEVAEGGFGFTSGEHLISISWSSDSGSLLTGSTPLSARNFSIRRLSKTCRQLLIQF